MLSLKDHILVKKPSHSLLQKIAKIHEYKEKELFFEEKYPKRLKALSKKSKEDSVQFFHRSFKKRVSKKQFTQLLQGKALPASSFEQEMLGYYEVLSKIHRDYKKMSLSSPMILKLFRELYQYTAYPKVGWKTKNNKVTIVYRDKKWVLLKGMPAKQVPNAMDKLHKELAALKKKNEIEPVILIATYIFEFFVIHPFFDGNGRICRLLILLLLYQFGFHIGKYISLEKIIERHYDEYYVSLYHCTLNKNDLLPWWEYIAKILDEAYRELERECKKTG